MSTIEVLDKEIRKYDGITDGLVACITYSEDEKEKYLINVCIVDDMLLPGYFITEDKRLIDFEATPWSEISEEDSKLMDRMEKKAHFPETEEEIELAKLSIRMIKEKCLEMNLMSKEQLDEETDFC